MQTVDQLMDRVSQLMSDNSKMAGKMSAICGYLDAVDVPKIAPVHRRVQLLATMYREERARCDRLKLLLDAERCADDET